MFSILFTTDFILDLCHEVSVTYDNNYINAFFIINDHPLYSSSFTLTCSSWYAKLLTGRGTCSSDPHIVFTICLCTYLQLICKVNFYPVMPKKKVSYFQLRKENSCSFLPEIIPLFLLTTLDTTSLPPLA